MEKTHCGICNDLKNFLKNTSVSLSFIVFFHKNFSSKIFPLRRHHLKNALEGRRVAYFFRAMEYHTPHTINSPAINFGAFTGTFKVNQSLIFYFCKKLAQNFYQNQVTREKAL